MMKDVILRRPYNLFLLTAALLLVVSFFFRNQSLDFHLHDTYYVVSTNYFVWALMAVLLFGWILYEVTNKLLLTRYLTWVHVLATIALVVICMTAGLWYPTLIPPVKGDYTWQTFEEEQQRQFKSVTPWFILLVVGQVAFIVNLVGGVIKRML
jgi:hypothetical protein